MPPLSRREREVVALVAEGLTNREVARRLFISERTVDGHLEHVREKLNVSSRVEITAWYLGESRAPEAQATTYSNLPLAYTSFIGRVEHVAVVKHRLGQARLVTLTGPGGVGKTRIGLEAAAEIAREADAAGGAATYSIVCFVDLARIASDGSVEGAIISALGGRQDPGIAELDTIAALLGNRRSIVVLDNCEHLIDQCAEVIDQLIRLSPQLVVLATSREALRLAGEVVIDIPPMSIDEAMNLFEQRALLIEPRLLDLANQQVISEICRRLDCLPLGIELAAAWVGLLSGEEILSRLDRRLSLLTRGPRTAAQRHATLRAAIAWSYGMLNDGQRTCLNELSVFAGGFSPAAAHAICGDADGDSIASLQRVAELASRSLLSATADVGGEARYRMLETVREFAAERLLASGREADVRSRHLAYFSGMAQQAAAELHGPQQLAWFDRLEQERGNLLLALDWGSHHDPAGALEMAGQLSWFWRVRGPYSEGPYWLERLLVAAPDARPEVRALALEGAGRLGVHHANWDFARRHLLSALEIWRALDDRKEIARTLVALAMLSEGWLLTGDSEELRDPDPVAALKEAIAIGESVGDHVSVASALTWLAFPTSREDLDSARQMLNEALRISREAGDDWMLALAVLTAGHVSYLAGEHEQALGSYSESLEHYRRLKEPWGISVSLVGVGRCELAIGRPEAAAVAAQQSLGVPGSVPDPAAFEVLAGVAAARDDYEKAVTLHGAAKGITTSEPRLIRALEAQEWTSAARARVTEADITRAWLRGKSMSHIEAIEYALEKEPASA